MDLTEMDFQMIDAEEHSARLEFWNRTFSGYSESEIMAYGKALQDVAGIVLDIEKNTEISHQDKISVVKHSLGLLLKAVYKP